MTKIATKSWFPETEHMTEDKYQMENPAGMCPLVDSLNDKKKGMSAYYRI